MDMAMIASILLGVALGYYAAKHWATHKAVA